MRGGEGEGRWFVPHQLADRVGHLKRHTEERPVNDRLAGLLQSSAKLEIEMQCRIRSVARICRLLSTSTLVGRHDVEKTPITAKLWAIRKAALDKEALVLQSGGREGKGRESVLQEKMPHMSRVEVCYNFASEPSLRDLYINTSGEILIGKIFEDMDSLAGTVAFVHCQDDDPHTLPPQLVTASCEAITLERAIAVKDIVMVGQVCWVGRSSLDVVVEIHEAAAAPVLVAPTPSRLLSSIFTYVSRSRSTGRSVAVNPLLVPPAETPEHSLWQQRDTLALARKQSSPHSSSSAAISSSAAAASLEQAARLLVLGRVARDMPALHPPHCILMQHTVLENTVLCQPQNTNTSGRVFGGILMHRAFDLAEACGLMFAGHVPALLRVDKILFKRPVEIGDLIRLKAHIVASRSGDQAGSQPQAVCEVTVQIVNPSTQSSHISNTFSFVFGYPPETRLKEVLPLSQEEASTIVAGHARL